MNDEYKEEIEHIVKCWECNSRDIKQDYDRGEIFCQDCGLVLDEDMLEDTHHGREKAGDKTSDRTHERIKTGYLLGAKVGNRMLDGSFDRSKMGHRLRRYDQRTVTNAQKTQIRGITAVKMLAANMEASEDIKEQCAFTYKKLWKDQIFRGQSLEVRAAAILYWVYKSNGMNRKIHEIIQHNGAHPRQVTKLVRKIASHFRQPWLLSERNMQGDIDKYCAKMQMEQRAIAETQQLAIPIEQMGEAMCLSMNTGFVAAIIYMGILCRNYCYRTQRDISDVCGITEVTLRNNFKEICKHMGIDKDNLKDGYYTVEDIVNGVYKNE